MTTATLMQRLQPVLLCGAGALFLAVSCRPSMEIKSAWMKNAVAVDGAISEWQGLLTHDPDGRFSMGVANDDSALYVCLTSSDRAIVGQILRFGMTVWFENRKSKRGSLGICFPLGMENSGIDFRRLHEAQRDTAAMRSLMEEAFDALVVIGPGKTDSVPMKAVIAESLGIKVKAVPGHEKFTYELRLRLHPDSTAKYAVQDMQDSLVTIVYESTAPEEETYAGGRGNSGGGAPQGFGRGGSVPGSAGYGGAGPGSGGRMGSHNGAAGSGLQRRRGGPAEPFSMEVRVKLAAEHPSSETR